MTNAQYVFASAVVFSAAIVLHGMLGKVAQSVVNQGMDARRYEKVSSEINATYDMHIILDTHDGRIFKYFNSNKGEIIDEYDLVRGRTKELYRREIGK